jgi:DNA polymerase I-like protein with 3'-5' exonuclease and polymerase domains
MLSEGKMAWLKLLAEDGRIHGRVISNGTVTHRARHSRPNISQVPSANKPYGKECRQLFYAPTGWKMVGTDASGLELRMLAHYMHKYDNGAYADEILNGDIHTTNQKAAGLQTRNQAKSFIYAFLYGAGAVKIGSIAAPDSDEQTQKQVGLDLKKRFLMSLPALDQLMREVSYFSEDKGYIYSIDGRKTYVKSSHKALNCLLQSSGSILVKKWICLFYQELVEKFGRPSWDGVWTPCSFSHDDVILCVRENYVEQVQEIQLRNILEAGRILGIKIPTAGESKSGNNWYETH